MLSWAARNDDGDRIVKRFCLDVDKSSHTVVDCADAVKTSTNKRGMAGLNLAVIIINMISGDTGGGGAVQNIHPKLIEKKVMPKGSKKFNCQLHAQKKKLENACIKTFGKHGIGHCNVFQTAYVLVKMIKSIHEHGGKELLDKVHRLVVDKLVSSVE